MRTSNVVPRGTLPQGHKVEQTLPKATTYQILKPFGNVTREAAFKVESRATKVW